ncbi:monocarboxylate transporter 9 [Condylostylus longicornis]|uniref:monocarboxylate transporter 9 n=1 Tax=Condylostylus longicornis TaxID=2530218 RepID=UPI00244E0E17|nr:monocarboxylate transporter 9 [Condylostylus longicornis]
MTEKTKMINKNQNNFKDEDISIQKEETVGDYKILNEKHKFAKEIFFPEVKFSNISESSLEETLNNPDDDNLQMNNNNNNNEKKPRKRLISNESEVDSIVSTSTAGGDTDKRKQEIPDGGFGWVVVLASFCTSLIADGISFSFGLLYTELLVYFKESKSKTAWIGSLFLAVPLLVGPIMSNLVDKYGCRRMTIIGGLVSSSGFALASICNSIEMLYLTFGIISGLGLGIGYVTAVVSVAFWFDKKRTFATGIGASGTGIGTFLYAPFTQWLIENFGWRGATLILAGTMLHTCVFGALMRDPEWLIEENRLESRSQSVTTFSNSSCNLDEIKKLLENGASKEAVLDTLVTNYNTEANQAIQDPEDLAVKRYKSELFLPTYLHSPDIGSFDDIKSQSRRSLRQKVVKNSTSNEQLLSQSPTSPVPPEKKNLNNKQTHIASSETLSPSEKISPNNSTIDTVVNRSTVSLKSLNNSLLDENILKSKNLLNEDTRNSCLSLNENLINKSHHDVSPNIYQNEPIYHSLDVLNHNSVNTKSTIFSLLRNKDTSILVDSNSKKNSKNFANVEPIPENGEVKLNGGFRDNTNANNKKKIYRPSIKHHNSFRNAHYFQHMRIHRNSINYRNALMNTHRYRLRASSCPNIYKNSMTTLAREDEDTWYDNFVDILKSIFDFSLFLDLKFTIFNMSTLLLFIWFIIPYFYITEHMLKFKYTEEDGALLISIIGIFNTLGMIILGFIGDRPWLNVNIMYSICMLLCGLSVALMPLAVTNYYLLVALAVVFGLTFASTFSFTPSILVSLVDLDDFTCAYGLVLLVQGIGSLLGPPLAGLIYDITLKWDDSFYCAGLFIAFSGVLSYIVELLERRDERRNRTKNTTSSDSTS